MKKKCPVKIYISYHKNEEDIKEQFLDHLAIPLRNGELEVWEKSMVVPGEDIYAVCRNNLNNSNIILLLISIDYIADNYLFKR